MPVVKFRLGRRDYELRCQPGEEKLLLRAAATYDNEVQAILEQAAGRMPEPRLLLLASLMLADRTNRLEQRLQKVEDRLRGFEDQPVAPQPAEVSDELLDRFAELAARAEALAERLEDEAV